MGNRGGIGGGFGVIRNVGINVAFAAREIATKTEPNVRD